MSKRHNLRDFQQRVIDRLQDKEASAARVSMLGVQIAGQRWLVDMAEISEVLPLPRFSKVPFTKRWFCGLINVRGNLYGVIDVAVYQQDIPASGVGANRVLLVADRYDFNVAMLVEQVLGLRDVRNWRQTGREGLIEYQDGQGLGWLKLDIPDLFGQAEFLQPGV